MASADDAELTECRYAAKVHCAPHRHEYESGRVGPILLSCHETAEDCARFRGGYGVITRECVAAP